MVAMMRPALLAVSPPPVPTGTRVSGCCGVTDSHTGANPCGKFPSGEFDETLLKIKSLDDCIAACKRHDCTECDFVSWNPSNQGSEDCSWYRNCDFERVLPIHGYTSVKVKPTPPPPPPPPPANVTIDVPVGAKPTRNVSTIVTIEVDVMPFLGQKNNGKTAGGAADKAFYWLSQLGADMVRFAPWFPNERIVVAELEPPDCSRNFSSWNITLLDQIYADFARAVGNHSVAMQLSTLPSWMLTDGKPINATNPNPWEPDMNYGRQGGTFRDKSYAEAGRYIARMVSWFTKGGCHDECGNWHTSGHHYEWAVLSVLNEVQHEHFYEGMGSGDNAAVEYTKCFDAIAREVKEVNPSLTLIGPELGPEKWYTEKSTEFIEYFMQAKNHDTKTAPPIVSFHYANEDCDWIAEAPADSSNFFRQLECWITGAAAPLEKFRAKYAPETGFFCNEIYDGDGSGVNGHTMLGDTQSWNLAASWFGVAVGHMAELGFLLVGQDQLAGGPSPDNSASVSCLDWESGRPNGKYYSIQILAEAFGTGCSGPQGGCYKSLLPSTNTSSVYALPFVRNDSGKKQLLIANKLRVALAVTLSGGWCVAGTARVLEAAADMKEPGFEPPRNRSFSGGTIGLGPFALAVLQCQ